MIGKGRRPRPIRRASVQRYSRFVARHADLALLRRARLWVLVTVAVLAGTAPVGAWTQSLNDHPFGSPADCLDTSQWPCREWRKDGGLSIDVDVSLDLDLANANIDLRGVIRSSMEAWNSQPAVNPHLEELMRPSCDLCLLHDVADAVHAADYQPYPTP